MAQQPRVPQQPQQPGVLDPDHVTETICDGRFHIHPHGNLATLTFTHGRPAAADLFAGRMNVEEVVRARITMPLGNFAALRDLLNRYIVTGDEPMPAAGASSDTKH